MLCLGKVLSPLLAALSKPSVELTEILGEENLGSYRFNSTKSNHKFCKTCGSSLLIDFERPHQGEKDPAKDIMAVNVCSLLLSAPILVSSELHKMSLDCKVPSNWC